MSVYDAVMIDGVNILSMDMCSVKKRAATIAYKFHFAVVLLSFSRGERQALRAAKELSELVDGEALYAYCSPYKRAIATWDIIEDYLENIKADKNDESDVSESNEEEDSKNEMAGVEIIGMREEPRVAEQQFGNFRKFLGILGYC